MKFRFKKNERGYSDLTFPFLRSTIISTTKLLFRPKIVNPEYMPTTGPCFLYGNHSNYFDPFLMNVWATQEPTAGVMTREQFHKTIPALFMDSIGIVPTSKYVPEPRVIRSVMKMIDQKRMIVIFPEGGRRWDGKPKPIIESTLKLFYKMNIPVHPVQLHGSFLTWPRWADYIRPATTEITYLKPLIPGDFPDFESFAKVAKNALEFDEYNPPESCHPKYAYKPASGVDRFLYRCPITGNSNGIYTSDGHHIRSKFSNFNARMTPNSRLVDENEEVFSLIDVFDTIKAFPVWRENSFILMEKYTQVYEVNSSHELLNKGFGDATLNDDAIIINLAGENIRLTLDRILYISIEQNHKLSLTGDGFNYQFLCNTYSALQWQHFLRRMISGEKAVKK